MVSRINSQYATLDFEGPVQYFGADAKTPPGEATLAALFALADVLVITPIRSRSVWKSTSESGYRVSLSRHRGHVFGSNSDTTSL